MADNIAYSPTHPAVGNVAWQPAGPYATIAYADDGYSVTPMTGYPSVYPHVLNIPPRINAFADLARTPMYQPDPQVMQWFMQMMTEAMKAMSAPMPRGGGGGGSTPTKAASPAPTQQPQQPQKPIEGVSNITANVGSDYALSPLKTQIPMVVDGGDSAASAPVGNSIIGGPTNLLDIIAQTKGTPVPEGLTVEKIIGPLIDTGPEPKSWDDLYQKMWGGLNNLTLEQIISALTDSGPAPQTWDDLYQKMWGN